MLNQVWTTDSGEGHTYSLPTTTTTATSTISSIPGGQAYPHNTTTTANGNAALDDTGASEYFEIAEDLGQTTLGGVGGGGSGGGGGGERSVMAGSFWGKSPLFQSTPAVEPGGKMAAFSMAASRLQEEGEFRVQECFFYYEEHKPFKNL